MSDAGDEAAVKEITFNVKSSSDSKFVITVPENISVSDLKGKLATEQYANIEAGRQRLIYSGRVLKDADQLSVYKIKDGNTVHLVKGAASTTQQNTTSSSSTASVPPGAGVPTNLSTGTGTDPLAGLTGARYAGFAQLPGAEHFGADGGMGAPQSPEDLLRQLDNPMFLNQMNEAMNNPHIIRMMQNSPQIRNNPMLRSMLENPEMRRSLLNPEFIRRSMAMQNSLAGQGAAGMPLPGVTDTTPRTGTTEGTDSTAGNTTTQGTATGSPANPFGMFHGYPGMGLGGASAGAGAGVNNPFAALFGAGNAGGDQANPAATTQPGSGQDQQPNPQANPFASLFSNPEAMAAAREMMQNPEMMRMALSPEMMRMTMQSLGMGGGQPGDNATGGAPGTGSDAAAANPYANFFGGAGAAGGAGAGADPFGLFGGGFGAPPAAPADTRPPEEQYAEQLRQMNEMGFYQFERNVTALRRAGGNVQGAINLLLEDGI